MFNWIPASAGTTAGETYILNLSAYFSDPNDTLTYIVTSSDPNVATVMISGGVMTIIRK